MTIRYILGWLGWVLLPATSLAAQSTPQLTCEPTDQRHAIRIAASLAPSTSVDWRSRLQLSGMEIDADLNARSEPLEVFGQHDFTQPLDNCWVFKLVRQPAGWVLRLYDKDPMNGGIDLSQVTPPFAGGAPNARDIFGWHFRNVDNTGPNRGSVNAPQELRLFQFEPALTGTGGFKPDASSAHVNSAAGRGWLRIRDKGLTDLNTNQQARLNYLKFDACITWPLTEQERSDRRYLTELDYVRDELEIAGSCGLDLSQWRLSANVAPRIWDMDIDGDGAIDSAMQLIHAASDARSLGICRAGTWFHILGEVAASGGGFRRTLAALERWQVVARDFAAVNEVAGADVDPVR